MIRKLFAVLLIIGLSTYTNLIYSQGVTMYHMHLMQHRHQLNPSFEGSCGFYFGIPGASSVNFEIETRGLQFGNLIEDVNSFKSNIGEINYIANNIDLNIFSLGFRAGKSYFTLDASVRNNFNISLSEDLILFATSGNEQFIGETADFSGTGFSETLYLEYAIGYSRSIGDRLRIGGKLKYLNGLANFSFTDWNAGIFTAPDTYEMTFHSEASINASGPFSLEYDPDNPEIISDYQLIEDQKELIESYLLRNQNKGFALDLGANYQVNSWLNLSASVLDIFNQITWNENVYNISQSGEYLFEGIKIDDLGDVFSEENLDEQMTQLLDSVIDIFQLTNTNNSYVSNFGPRFYGGVNLQLFPGLTFGGLVRGNIVNSKTYLSYTGSINTRLGRVLSLSASATTNANGNFSLGGGLGLKLAGLQLFAIAENINAIYYDPEMPMVWPGNFDRIQLRFGLNLMFGCKSKKSKPDTPSIDLLPPVKDQTLQEPVENPEILLEEINEDIDQNLHLIDEKDQKDNDQNELDDPEELDEVINEDEDEDETNLKSN